MDRVKLFTWFLGLLALIIMFSACTVKNNSNGCSSGYLMWDASATLLRGFCSYYHRYEGSLQGFYCVEVPGFPLDAQVETLMLTNDTAVQYDSCRKTQK